MSDKFYAQDLAYIHDAGFLTFARRAAPHVLKRLRRRCGAGARVVEIGCGSGGLTQHLVEAKYRVLGVDIAAAMIRLARKRTPAEGFRVASWYNFTPPPCDAIVAVGECFNYMSAGRRRHETAVKSFLRRAGAAVPAGGLLLFDFLEVCAQPRRSRTRQRCGRDWAVLVDVDEDRRVITRRITAIRFLPGLTRCSRETHRQCRLQRRQVERALRAAGFLVTFHDGYGGLHLEEGHVVAEAIRMVG
jgi:cyclopropane fatty-acyl-phospholipid synthase-like methyltransferase